MVTRPFFFEGKRRRRQAEEGIESLTQNVDTLITIPNQRLVAMASERTSMKEAFRMADEVLLQAVQGVSDLINFQGMVNVDFADVRTVMSDKGVALMGVGSASGEHKTVEAAQRAISSPLLDDVSIVGATSVMINITGNANLTMYEIHEASSLIQEEAHEDAEVIWGWVIDESMEDEARVTVIATGFEESRQMLQPQSIERRVNERVVRTGGPRPHPGPRAALGHRPHLRGLRHPDVLPQRGLTRDYSRKLGNPTPPLRLAPHRPHTRVRRWVWAEVLG